MKPPDMEDVEGHYQVPGGRFFCLVATPANKDSGCGGADTQEDSCADEVCTCTDESMDSGVQEDLTGGSSEEGLETFKQVEEVLVAEGCRLPDGGTTKVVVAIDLGTAYSGYAFSFTDDASSQIYVMSSNQGGDPGIINQKIPTTLLLTPKEEFHSFGFAARDFFHDLEPQEAKKWLYFDKFKMVLHNNEVMGRDSTVRAANGKVLPALTVLAHALRHLGTLALREVRHRQLALELSAHSVRWVLTVPALWQPPARQLLREAAVQAGICSADNPDGLLIALEPEVASIYCRKQNFENVYANTEDNSLEETAETGTHYMVVDCGGGTVDITVHELCSYRGTLRELHTAVGGPWGSLGVDSEFENLLVSIFGEEFMDQFKLKRPAAYVELMVSFEARKRVASSFRDTPFNIFPPFAFIEYYRRYKGKEVDHAFKKLGRKDITWSSQGMLRLQPELMKELFEPTICSILKCIQDVFDQSSASKIKYLFLVGGFAESEILQFEVKQAFGTRTQIIIPQETGISILKGAVMFGLDPRVIAVRRSKHTYGVGVLKPFKEKEHPRDKLVEKGGVVWCADVLDKFVEADQDISVGETVVRRYTPTKNSQEYAVIKIYCVESENAKFITDPGVKHCGTLKLDLAQTQSPCREIQICMVFGGTEVTASAIDVSSGNRVHVQVDFLTNN